MIDGIRGVVAELGPDSVVVFTDGGIGYRVLTGSDPGPTRGDDVEFYTHLAVKEDSLTLYGFETQEERETFRLLISASGVGPKTALAALSRYTVDEIKTALASADAKTLSGVPGIGKKVAERMIVELRDKVGAVAAKPAASRQNLEDAVGALVSLGYKKTEAVKLVEATGAGPESGVEDIVRAACSRTRL